MFPLHHYGELKTIITQCFLLTVKELVSISRRIFFNQQISRLLPIGQLAIYVGYHCTGFLSKFLFKNPFDFDYRSTVISRSRLKIRWLYKPVFTVTLEYWFFFLMYNQQNLKLSWNFFPNLYYYNMEKYRPELVRPVWLQYFA